MKLNVLFIGDNHISARTPANRKDNYLEATLNKLKDCLELGVKHKVDAIVLLGDVFDTREEGPLARNGALNILKSQPDGVPWPFPVYVVVGNHDIQSSFSLDKSSLGTLINSGVLEKTDYVENLGIAFAHFTPELDENIKNGSLKDFPAMIWACHASIVDVPDSRFADKLVVFDEIPLHENTKMVISGHIHHPMTQIRKDGAIFINPGAIGRYSASKDNLSRDLKVFLLVYDLEGTIYKQEYLYLPSAQHYSDVFKMDQIILNKEQKKEAQEFVKKITLIQSNNWAYTVLDDRLSTMRTFGEKKNVEKEVIDVAVEELRLANIDLKSEEI
jgi:DNA repair exonuclease SbcCD nuclease subunit